jgi:PAS domain S-box-containing protein
MMHCVWALLSPTPSLNYQWTRGGFFNRIALMFPPALSLESCQRYALQLLAAIPDAAIVTDTTGMIKVVNPAAQALLEFTELELIAQPIAQFILEPQLLPQDGYIPSEAGFQKTMDVTCRTQSGKNVLITFSRSTLVSDWAELQGYLYIGRDVTERQRAERKLKAEHAIAQIFAGASSLSAATPKILQTICQTLEWDLGELWTVDPQTDQLRCVETWLVPSLHIPEFDRSTQQIQIPAGVGLPGKVWQSGQPLWMPDVTQDESFLRAAPAARAGLHAAVGFPIFNGTETLGVMVFFSRTIQPPNPQLLSMMSAIASQIGQFVRRRQTEDLLCEMRSRFQSLFEAAAGLAITTLEGQILEANAALGQLLGHGVESMINRRVHEFVHPDDRAIDQDLQQQLLSGAVPYYQIEKRWLTQTGVECWTNLTISMIRSPQPIAYMIQVQDITQRRQTETILAAQTLELESCQADLYQQTHILQSVLENVTDGVVIVDEVGKFLAFNPAAQRIYGTSAVEIEPRQWVEPKQLLSPQQPNTAAHPSGKFLLLRALRGETAEGVEVYVHRRNQQDGIWVNTTALPLRDEAGTVQGGVLVIRDVSDRKQAESILEQQFQRSLLLKQITQDVRQRLDIQLILQTAIAQLGQVLRVSRGMIYTWVEIPSQLPQVQCVTEFLESGYASVRELEISWSGNPYLEQVLVQDEAIAVPNVYTISQLQGLEPFYQQIGLKSMLAVRTTYNQEINGIICLHQCDQFRDWNAYEIELLETVATQVGIALKHADLWQQTTRQQQQIHELTDTLADTQQVVAAANLATHQYLTLLERQLKPPLQQMSDLLQQLQGSLLDPQQRNSLTQLSTTCKTAMTQMNEVLDFYKISTHTFTLEYQPFNLIADIEESLERFAIPAAAKGISIVLLIDLAVPERGNGDRDRLQQVMQTLLQHSLEWLEPGELAVHVSVPSSDDSAISLTIEGRGSIAEAQRLQLFQPFNPDNTGLGLALCQQLCQEMGGDLGVEGDAEHFRFCATVHLPSEAHPLTLILQGKRFLIVDRSPLGQESLSLQVRRWGGIPRSVASITEAITQLCYERFDGMLIAWDGAESERSSFSQLHQQMSDAQLPWVLVLPEGIEIEKARLSGGVICFRSVRYTALQSVLTQVLGLS